MRIVPPAAAVVQLILHTMLYCDQASQIHHQGHWGNVVGLTWMMVILWAGLVQPGKYFEIYIFFSWAQDPEYLECNSNDATNNGIYLKKKLFSIGSLNWISFLGSHKETQSSYPSAKNTLFWRHSSSSEGEKGALILWDERRENGFHLGAK